MCCKKQKKRISPAEAILYRNAGSIALEFFVIEVRNRASYLLKHIIYINVCIIAVKTLQQISVKEKLKPQERERWNLHNGSSAAVNICQRKAEAAHNVVPARQVILPAIRLRTSFQSSMSITCASRSSCMK
jgi:hypothetical protein